MSLSTSAEWLRLIKKKFERQVDAKSTLIEQWLLTASLGVEKKGEQYYRRAQSIFQNVNKMRVLDAGCGDGSIALRFALAGADVTGLDIDCEFIEIARIRRAEIYPNTPILFRCTDLCDKDLFTDTGFDLIISIDVIEHVSNASHYLSTLKAMLNPSGKIWLFTPNRYALGNILSDPHYKLTGLTLLPNSWADWYATHFRKKTRKYEVEQLYTQHSLKKLVESSKLKITYQSHGDFENFINKRVWLDIFVKLPTIRAFVYKIYLFQMSTIETILS